MGRLHVYLHLEYYVSGTTGVCSKRLTIHTIGRCPKGGEMQQPTSLTTGDWPEVLAEELVVEDDIQK